jgi:sporulation protein YlmC with PRC-barrel domain
MKYIIFTIFFISIATTAFAQYQRPFQIYKQEEKFGIKDARQEIIVKPIYKDIKMSAFGMFAVESEARKWAIFDKDGIRVSDFIYDRMEQKLPGIIEVRQGGSVGLISEKGNKLIPVEYDKIAPVGKVILTETGIINNSMKPKVFIYRGAIVTKSSRSGYFNKDGQKVLDVIYDRVRATADFNLELGFIDVVGLIVKNNEMYAAFDENGQNILPFEYNYINAMNKMGFGELQKDNKKGLYDKHFTIIAQPIYEEVTLLNTKFFAGKNYEKWEIKATDGSPKIYAVVDDLKPFSNGFAQVVKDGKVSIIKDDGEIKLPFEYDKAIPFGRNILLTKGDKNYIYDSKGKVKLWSYPMDISWQNLSETLKPIKTNNQKWGYINDDGDLEIKAEFDEAGSFKNGIAIVCKNNLCGFMNKNGKKITDLVYELPDYRIRSAALLAKKDGKFGYLDAEGNVLISLIYDELFEYNFIIKAKKEGKWGFINKNEIVVIPLNNDFIEDFDKNKLEFRFQNKDKIGWLDKNGQERIAVTLESWADEIVVLDDGISRIKVNNYYGLVQKNGKWIVPIRYENDFIFDEFGKAIVRENQRWGMIYKGGNVVLPTIYQEKFQFNKKQLACVRNNGKYGIVNYDGKVIIPTIYDRYIYSDYEFWTVQKDGQFGMINKNGKIVIPIEYEKVFSYLNDLALVKKSGKWGYINAANQIAIPFEYEVLNSFIDGRALAKKGNYWGMINLDNTIILSFEYDNLISESDGFINVSKGGFWGVLNSRFEVVVPFEYDRTDALNGFFRVEKNNKIGLFTKKGAMILPAFYDGLTIDEYGFKIQKDGKFGLLNNEGAAIIPMIYDEFMYFSRGLSRVKKGSYYGMISTNGKLVIPCEYLDLGIRFRGDFIDAQKDGRYGILNQDGETVIRFRYEKIRWINDTTIEGLVNGVWEKVEI